MMKIDNPTMAQVHGYNGELIPCLLLRSMESF